MAAASLLALIDDIATILDDVAVMTQVAAKKTAGVLGDDLALNAQQVAGVRAERELPVVWAVAKGSLINKAILVPLALMISVWAPAVITPLLMLGGVFLCFEGVEKLAHRWLHTPQVEAAEHESHLHALAEGQDLVALERDKIKGAVRTDFVLSAEIIAITLGTVALAPLTQQAAVLVGIALIMTVGVYGLVAGIVKLDDGGLALSRRADRVSQWLGQCLLALAPLLMRGLTVVGTAAMFMVGGGILAHGWPAAHHGFADVVQTLAGMPWMQGLATLALEAALGVLAGTGALAAWLGAQRVRGFFRPGSGAGQ
jgi:uncharacterized protein